jgi:small subunit ribosomal protein S1
MSKAKNIHKADSKMEDLLKEKDLELKEYHPGDLVEGIVVSVSHGEILMDVGAKSEGIISGQELIDSDDTHKKLKPGDKVLAMVVQAENEQGYIVLSLKRAEKDRKWRIVEEAYEDGSILECTVLEYNKGGLLVDCLGLRGFVPLSHLDRVHFTEDIGKYASGSDAELKEILGVLSGKTLKVKVIEVDRNKNRLVLSEKEAMGTYSKEAREKKLEKINVGDVMEGVVTGIMNFGIFVDLEGIEGLVHISEIAWEKVNHPGDYYQVGSPIEVKVLGIDEDSKKLALSVKQLTENPWETVEEKYPVGTKVTGTVSKIVPFGAFVNLEKGLDGLIHVSETDGPLEEGQQVTAVVTQVDGANQKLALSVRQLDREEGKSEDKKDDEIEGDGEKEEKEEEK